MQKSLWPASSTIPIFPLYDVRFPEARMVKRKIIYHAGPTNSGKTHSALERFQAAKSGVYCGPLRLLATEVFRRTNDAVSTCTIMVQLLYISSLGSN